MSDFDAAVREMRAVVAKRKARAERVGDRRTMGLCLALASLIESLSDEEREAREKTYDVPLTHAEVHFEEDRQF